MGLKPDDTVQTPEPRHNVESLEGSEEDYVALYPRKSVLRRGVLRMALGVPPLVPKCS